uniref:Regulator of G-protein signaling 16 n=1 Tax=Sus scrofa TaxID=9823 RepID=A0A8D2BXC3_PIG
QQPRHHTRRAKEFKTRLGIFLHKSELGSDPASVGKFEWGSKHSKDGRNFSEDVLGWRESFDLLLSSKNGVAAFHTFLKTEFSEENLEFWLACEEFKKLRSATKLASRAHRIFEEFIRSEAPKEVRGVTYSRDSLDPGCSFPTENWGWWEASRRRAAFRSSMASSGTGGWRLKKPGSGPSLGALTLRCTNGAGGGGRAFGFCPCPLL